MMFKSAVIPFYLQYLSSLHGCPKCIRYHGNTFPEMRKNGHLHFEYILYAWNCLGKTVIITFYFSMKALAAFDHSIQHPRNFFIQPKDRFTIRLEWGVLTRHRLAQDLIVLWVFQ